MHRRHPASKAGGRQLPRVLRSLLLLSILLVTDTPTQAQTTGAGVKRSVDPASLGELSTTVVLGAAKDNTLFENGDGGLSNGAGFFIFAGRNNLGQRRRGLIAFDIAAQVPAGALIESAQLRLEMNRTVAGNIDVDLVPVLADWGEGTSDAEGQEGMGATSMPGDATWVHTFFDTSTWTTLGGDFSNIISASQTVGAFEFYTWGSNPEMVSQVQAWLDNPSSNFGWALIGDESASRTVKRFASRENSAPTTRPTLTITYRSLDVVFFDGFESGDATAWSSQMP